MLKPWSSLFSFKLRRYPFTKWVRLLFLDGAYIVQLDNANLTNRIEVRTEHKEEMLTAIIRAFSVFKGVKHLGGPLKPKPRAKWADHLAAFVERYHCNLGENLYIGLGLNREEKKYSCQLANHKLTPYALHGNGMGKATMLEAVETAIDEWKRMRRANRKLRRQLKKAKAGKKK